MSRSCYAELKKRALPAALALAVISFMTLAAYARALAAAEDAKTGTRVLTPARRDGINDVATFGNDAVEVRVYDVRGRLVFQAERQGAAPIVWDGRDARGGFGETGVYVVRIRRKDNGLLYQSIVLAR